MKKITLVLFAISLAVIACKKENSSPTQDPIKYMSFTANSTWNYEVINNLNSTTSNYTLTSTSRDSTVNGKAYHVFTNSSGSANEYYYLTGNDYFRFQNLPAPLSGNPIENIYLKDNAAVNESWNQIYSVTASGIPLIITTINTITEKGISKTVNSIVYTDVIHITSTLTASVFGTPLPDSAITTDVQVYYSKKYGMIQSKNKININYTGIVSNTDELTNLKSADIK